MRTLSVNVNHEVYEIKNAGSVKPHGHFNITTKRVLLSNLLVSQ